MSKTKLLLQILFVLLAVAALAQSDSAQQNTTTPNASSVTLRGCLTGSAGTYVLVADQQGKPYMLQGDKTDLDKMIHHEVEVSGQLVSETGGSQTQTSGSNSTNRMQPPGATLKVFSARDVADTCAAKSAR